MSSVAFAQFDQGSTATVEVLTDSYPSAFIGAAVIAALGFLVTVTVIRTRDSRAHVELTRRSKAATPTPATQPTAATRESVG